VTKVFTNPTSHLVVWNIKALSGATKVGTPMFKEAKEAGVEGFLEESEFDGELLADMLSLWTVILRRGVEINGTWNTLRLENLAEFSGLLVIRDLLRDRKKDEWLAERYRDSFAQRDWNTLSESGRFVMRLLDESKLWAFHPETVRVLCNRINALLQIRSEGLDDKLWAIESGAV